MALCKPKSGVIYTYSQIISDLYLRDSPSLTFFRFKEIQCVQDSHVLCEQVMGLDGWPDSPWEYRYETEEWIPIFRFNGTQEELNNLVDIELVIDPYSEGMDLWVTPKGLQRPQYHHLAVTDLGPSICDYRNNHDKVVTPDSKYWPCFDERGQLRPKEEWIERVHSHLGQLIK